MTKRLCIWSMLLLSFIVFTAQMQAQTPQVLPSQIIVKSTDVNLQPGRTYQIQADVIPAEASDKSLTFSSSNATVATVSSTGLITAIWQGTCVITITSVSNPTVICTIALQVIGEGPQVTTIVVQPKQLSINVNTEESIMIAVFPIDAAYKEVQYFYDGDVISVKRGTLGNFIVKGLRSGRAKVFFHSVSNSNVFDTCSVTVTNICSNSAAPKPKNDTVFITPTLNDYKNGKMPIKLEVESVANSQYVWEGNWTKTTGSNILETSITTYDSSNVTFKVYRTDLTENCVTESSIIRVIKKPCVANPTFVSDRYYNVPPDADYPTFEVKENDAVWYNTDYNPIMNGTKLLLNATNLQANEYMKFFVVRQNAECISEPQYVYVTKYGYVISGYISLPAGVVHEPYIVDVNKGEYRISSDKWGKFMFKAPKAGTYTFTLKSQGNIVSDITREVVVTATNYSPQTYFYPTVLPHTDLSITSIGTMAVVGRVMNITALIYNFGKKVYDVPVSIVYDSLVTPISTNNQAIVDSKRMIQCSVDSVDEQSTAYITYTFVVSTDWRNQGKVISFTTKLDKSFDTIAANDSSIISTTILNSYDPNDKAVSPAFGDKGYVLLNQPLEFLIRFQNVGTIDAENIKVRDTLDENLDLSTFEVLAQSHPMTWQMNGRELVFRFDDIHLLDSTTNEKASHGYVKYRIKPKANLTENTKVANTAHIFFDYNPAVVTNTTSSVYVSKLPISTSSTMNALLQPQTQPSDMVYPNPAQKSIQLAVSEKVTLQITTIDGQVIKTINAYLGESVDVSSLTRGIYSVTVSSDTEVKTYQFVKE